MPSRPAWKGDLEISLVRLGVALHLASESGSRISFHQISRSTGERIRHARVLHSESVARELTAPIEQSDVVKGYEYERGRYVVIEPSELAQLRMPSKRTIRVAKFIDREELHHGLIERPYFLVPENDSHAEAFAVVRESMRRRGKVAIGTVAFSSGRESIVALVPIEAEGGMMAYTLRYAYEMRDHREYFHRGAPGTLRRENLQLADLLIERMSEAFEHDRFEDAFEQAVKELVDAKIHHLPVPVDQEPVRPSRGIDLMEALRRSVAGAGQPGKKPVGSARATAAANKPRLVKTPAKSTRRRSA